MKHHTWTPTATSSPSPPRHSLLFGSQKISLHLKGQEFEPKAHRVQTGSGDLCFVIAEPVAEVLGRLKSHGLEVLEGGQVVKRTGAVGAIQSVYTRDPDGNLIE
jgi:catechol 2,3-dioxygenase-like lactoylglutathione lyase family enzyme